MFTKLLQISMVAKSRFGRESRIIILSGFSGFLARSSWISLGVMEKNATSLPEKTADKNKRMMVEIEIPMRSGEKNGRVSRMSMGQFKMVNRLLRGPDFRVLEQEPFFLKLLFEEPPLEALHCNFRNHYRTVCHQVKSCW